MPKIWNIQREEEEIEKTKDEQDGPRDERGREKVGMVNEVECWQRIISMTSKGVVISRCLSPSCHGLRVVSHPRVIVLIQAVPFRPDFPFTPRSPFCSASSSHLVLPPRFPPSLSSSSSLLKHNFRRQTKRVGVAYNEARSFVFSAAPFSCRPSSRKEMPVGA